MGSDRTVIDDVGRVQYVECGRSGIWVEGIGV
jgi:hypothetical protein